MMIKPTQQRESEKAIKEQSTLNTKLSDSPKLGLSLISDSTSCNIGLGFSIPMEQCIDNITFEDETEETISDSLGISFMDHQPTQPTISTETEGIRQDSILTVSVKEGMMGANANVEDSKARIEKIYCDFKDALQPEEQHKTAEEYNVSLDINFEKVAVDIVDTDAAFHPSFNLLMEQYEDANVVVKEKIVEVAVNKRSMMDRLGIMVNWMTETFIVVPVKSIFRTVHNGIHNLFSFLGAVLKLLIITALTSTILYVLISNVHPGSSPQLLAKQSYDTVKELIITLIADTTTYFQNPK